MGTIVAEVIDSGNRDVSGRRRASAVELSDYMQAYRGSGMNKRVFARREGPPLLDILPPGAKGGKARCACHP